MSYGYTTIYHGARIQMGLNLNEYALAELIYRLSTNDGAPVPGWCSMSNRNLAGSLGLDYKTTQRALNKLHKSGFLFKGKNGRFYKTSGKWIQGDLQDFTNRDKMTPNEGQNDPKTGDKMTPYNYNIIKKQLKEQTERQISRNAIDFLKNNNGIFYDRFMMMNKPVIKEWDKFLLDYSDTVDLEGLKYESNILIPRINKYARNWIANQERYNKNNQDKDFTPSVAFSSPSFRVLN